MKAMNLLGFSDFISWDDGHVSLNFSALVSFLSVEISLSDSVVDPWRRGSLGVVTMTPFFEGSPLIPVDLGFLLSF